MRNLLFASLLLCISINSFSQKQEEILEEAERLYKSEMASWYGTDLFLEKLPQKREKAGAYLSYVTGDTAICIFFSKGDKPKVVASFHFDSTYNTRTAVIDDQDREPTAMEAALISIREKALQAYQSDTLFKSYKDMNPNFIPLNDEKGKRVYVLTGPANNGIVVLGNDYLISFDKNENISSKKRLHKNIITLPTKGENGEEISATVHSHLPETGDLITATDICTLKLYGKFTTWEQHYVMSDKYVSIWDCKKNMLTVLTKKAWDKIAEKEKEKK